MKRLQIMLAAAVVFAVGSAFTAAKADATKVDKGGFATVSFVRVSGVANSTNRLDYEYRPSAGCQSAQATCKANWIQSNSAPAVGSNPQTSATFDAVTQPGNAIVQ